MTPHGIDKSVVWYLAGKMTGIKSFNYPYFGVVASRLRADGYQIISPADMDTPEQFAHIMRSEHGDPRDLPQDGTTWGTLLARDIPVVADQCGGIIFLPKWWESRGARLEATAGLLCGKQFAAWGSYSERAYEMTAAEVASRLSLWLSGF